MFNSIRVTALSVGLLGVLSFIIALLWEYWGEAAPCIMCYIERWGFLLSGMVGLCTLPCKREITVQRFLAVMGFIFAATSVVLFRHMGTQYKWFQVPGMCRASRPLSEADLSAQLLNPVPQMTCDHIEFTLFGQPPTFYFFCFALLLAGICFWGFFKDASQNRRRYFPKKTYFV